MKAEATDRTWHKTCGYNTTQGYLIMLGGTDEGVEAGILSEEDSLSSSSSSSLTWEAITVCRTATETAHRENMG